MHRLLLLLTVLIFISAKSHADPVSDLYRAETVVTGTVEPERTRGFRVGLTDVAVKLTGNARLAENGKLAPLLEDPHPLVEWFEYEDRMKNIPVHDEQGTRERPHFLRMRFNKAELDNGLAKLGLSQWSDRPLLAVWLGVKTAARSAVVTASGNEAYGQRIVLTETSKRRGIPVLLPEGDGAGPAATFEDVAEDDIEKLRGASKEAGAWLSGVLSVTDSGYWDITWHFHWRGKAHSWTDRGVSFDVAIRDGLETAALILSGNEAM